MVYGSEVMECRIRSMPGILTAGIGFFRSSSSPNGDLEAQRTGLFNNPAFSIEKTLDNFVMPFNLNSLFPNDGNETAADFMTFQPLPFLAQVSSPTGAETAPSSVPATPSAPVPAPEATAPALTAAAVPVVAAPAAPAPAPEASAPVSVPVAAPAVPAAPPAAAVQPTAPTPEATAVVPAADSPSAPAPTAPTIPAAAPAPAVTAPVTPVATPAISASPAAVEVVASSAPAESATATIVPSSPSPLAPQMPISTTYTATPAPILPLPPGSPQPPDPGMKMMVWMGCAFVIMYFLMIRPQTKRQKELQAQLAKLKTGDKVITNSGFHGVVANVKEGSTLILKLSDNLKVEIDKTAIATVVKPVETKPAEDKKPVPGKAKP